MKNIFLFLLIILFNSSLLAQNKSKKINYHRQFYHGLVKVDKSYFHHKNLLQSKTQIDTVHIYNNSEDALTMSFRKTPSYISVTTKPAILQAEEEGVIIISYRAFENVNKNGLQKWGKDYQRIVVYAKKETQTNNRLSDYITLRTFIVEDFSHLSRKELKKAPIIQFDTLIYDFGKVPQGEAIVHDFIFENKGENDLSIRYAKAC